MEMMIVVAFILGTTFFCSVLFMLLGLLKERTLVHFLAFAFLGILIGVAVNGLVNLYDWIELGLRFTDWGASTLVFGMVLVNVVMAWNFIATDGETLVR